MIDRTHELSLARQAQVLGMARSTVYYAPRPVSAGDLALMRRLDALHLDTPFAGARMLRALLAREGRHVGRRHMATLMKRMGISAIRRRPNTSKPAPGHRIYPYLLRGVKIERPNHVWAMDISYIPMRRGFVYLAAVVDVFSRRVLAHRAAITLEAAFCVEALEEALARHGKPDIVNRSGQPVHLAGVHARADRREDRHQHGRQGRLARQRLRRAVTANGEIRGGVSARLRQRVGGAGFHPAISDLLQSGASAFAP